METNAIIEGIIAGITAGGFLTAIGGLFVWLALKVSPTRALGIYALGVFIKTVIGTGIIVVVALLTGIHLMSFMLTLGGIVCVSYPLMAIIMTSMQDDLYQRVG